jgi:hypothetical protein
MTTTDPPVGLGTKVGLGVSSAAFVAAVVAFITGDRSEQTLGVLVSAAVGALTLAVTIGGRMLQAALRGRGPAADALAAELADLGRRLDTVAVTAKAALNRAESANAAAVNIRGEAAVDPGTTGVWNEALLDELEGEGDTRDELPPSEWPVEVELRPGDHAAGNPGEGDRP